MNSTMDFYKQRDLVFMREEFFGNAELRDFMNGIIGEGVYRVGG